MEPKIEFRTVRDFGEIINDTFLFLKQNFKPLLKCLIYIAGIFIIMSTIASVIQQLKVANVIGDIKTGAGTKSAFSKFNFGIEYFITIIISYVTYFLMMLIIFCYMAVYQENDKRTPTVDEVWTFCKYYFLRFIIANVLFGLLFIAGFVLCLLPGIYLLPIISLMSASIVLENAGINFAFSRGFNLIKEHWWSTFAAMLIVYIIFYATTLLFSIPLSLASGVTLFIPNANVSKPLLILASVITHICQLFVAIPTVATGLLFFSLVERKEAAGLMQRIQTFGNDNAAKDLPEEEF